MLARQPLVQRSGFSDSQGAEQSAEVVLFAAERGFVRFAGARSRGDDVGDCLLDFTGDTGDVRCT